MGSLQARRLARRVATPEALACTSILSCAIGLLGCGQTSADTHHAAGPEAGAGGEAACVTDCAGAGGAGGAGGDSGTSGTSGSAGAATNLDCGPLPERPELEPLAEADPDWTRLGPVLELTRVPVSRIEVADDEPLIAGAAVRVAVQTQLPNDCWVLGPLRVSGPGAQRAAFFEQLAFQELGGECGGGERQETRGFELTAPEAGCWWLVDAVGDTTMRLIVGPAEEPLDATACADPNHTTPTGGACAQSCECGWSNSCLAVDPGTRVCGVSCVLDSDCPEGSCVLGLAPGVGTCQPYVEDQCEGDSDCAPGESCADSDGVLSCRLDGMLGSQDRHECASDDDCSFPGARCVLMSRSDGKRGQCDLPCSTDRTVCPPAHSCSPVIGRDPVCDWVGE